MYYALRIHFQQLQLSQIQRSGVIKSRAENLRGLRELKSSKADSNSVRSFRWSRSHRSVNDATTISVAHTWKIVSEFFFTRKLDQHLQKTFEISTEFPGEYFTSKHDLYTPESLNICLWKSSTPFKIISKWFALSFSKRRWVAETKTNWTFCLTSLNEAEDVLN